MSEYREMLNDICRAFRNGATSYHNNSEMDSIINTNPTLTWLARGMSRDFVDFLIHTTSTQGYNIRQALLVGGHEGWQPTWSWQLLDHLFGTIYFSILVLDKNPQQWTPKGIFLLMQHPVKRNLSRWIPMMTVQRSQAHSSTHGAIAHLFLSSIFGICERQFLLIVTY